MGKFRRDLDSGALKVVEEVMDMMHVIKITRDLAKSEVVYEWIGNHEDF